MPIRPDLKPRYPPRAEWLAIRKRIWERAQGRCEHCGKPDRTSVYTVWDGSGRWLHPETGQWFDRRGIAIAGPVTYRLHTTLVILTTAHHPDPAPENCADGNLHCLCQGCHLRLDKPHHILIFRRNWRRKRQAERERSQLSLAAAGLEVPAALEETR